MKLLTINIIALLMLFCSTLTKENTIQAQTSNHKTNQANSPVLLKKAEAAYQNFKFSIAADYFESFLKDQTHSSKDVLTKLADCYWQMRDYSNALHIYKQLYPAGNDGNASLSDQIHIAELSARYGEYQQAYEWLKSIPGYELKAKAYKDQKSLNLMKKDSINWTLRYLNINTDYREFSPFLLGNNLFFSSNKPTQSKTESFGWDGNNYVKLWKFQVSDIDSTTTQPSDSISRKSKLNAKSKKLAGLYEYGDNKQKSNAVNILINQSYLNGDSKPIGSIVKGFEKIQFNAGAISVDKNNHIYFSSNYTKADKNNVNRICIMEGVYDNSGVTKIHQLPFGDANSYSVMHPAINPAGTLLVFSSDKSKGKGGYDLYYTQRQSTKLPWDSVKTFANKINTAGNEVFPNITADGYLYYSSDAMPGLGGLDIFRIPLQDALDGKGEPQHLSYPINSQADDFGWTQDSTGTKGYLTSDRLNGNDNLYSFNYRPAKISRAPRKSFFEGTVVEKESLTPIEGATVFLYEKAEKTVYIAKTNVQGKYSFPVFTTSDVVIKAIDNRYLGDCTTSNVVYEPQPSDTIQKSPRDLMLDKFKVGFVWKLSNIHYDFNKANIRTDAKPILDSLVTILNSHPITVELGSHTDSRGTATYNARLSQHRADAAVEYLIQHGIDAKRITAKGYGESQLLNKCADGVPCSDEEHQANRRTEVKVTGYTVPQKQPVNIDTNKFKDKEKIDSSALPTDFFDECK